LCATPVRRQAALQYWIFSQSRAARRVRSITSPHTLQTLLDKLAFFGISTIFPDVSSIVPAFERTLFPKIDERFVLLYWIHLARNRRLPDAIFRYGRKIGFGASKNPHN